MHRQGTKRRWNVYYITDEGGFGSKRISALMVPYYKGKVEKYKFVECPACWQIYTSFYKKREELEDIPCPTCCYFSTDNEDDED